MHYACALKSTGLMRYVTAPARCTPNETSVKIFPGPHYVCVHPNKTVHLVAALSDCVPPTGVRGLTLPSPNGRVHFCAANGTGVLTYVTFPGRCTSTEFPVVVRVVPHQPPVLANIEPGTLQYDAGTAAVPVTSSLTVSSPDVRSLAGATVTISTGLVPGEDSLSFTNQNGITGSYDSGTGVLTLTGASPLANYQAALRSVTFSDSNGATPATRWEPPAHRQLSARSMSVKPTSRLLGTTFGGDGRTTFGLPNLQARTAIHRGSGYTLGQSGGEQNHVLAMGEQPVHSHVAVGSAIPGDSPIPAGNVLGAADNMYGPLANTTAIAPATITNAGGSQPHNNMQPYLVLNFCIALQGVFPTQN